MEDEEHNLPDYHNPETGAVFEIKTARHGGLQHDLYTQAVDYTKSQKRSMKRSRDNAGRLIELHPTKGWRRVKEEKTSE